MKKSTAIISLFLVSLFALFGWGFAMNESGGARYWRERAGREMARANSEGNRTAALRGDAAQCLRDLQSDRDDLLQARAAVRQMNSDSLRSINALLTCNRRGDRFERTVRRLCPALPEEIDASSEDGLDP